MPELEVEYTDKVSVALEDLYACTRVWEAWQYNTMTQDDFIPANEDPDVIENVMAVIRPLLTHVDRMTDALDVADKAPHASDCYGAEMYSPQYMDEHCDCWKAEFTAAKEAHK